MSGDVFFGFYWPPRPESAAVAAERIHRFLAGLSELVPRCREWRHTAMTRKAAGTRLDATAVGIEQQLHQSVRPADAKLPNSPGQSLHVWSEQGAAALDVRVGSELPYASVPNSVVLSFPDADDAAAGKSAAFARNILELGINSFEPTWAVCSTSDIQQMARVAGCEAPGWITWVPGSNPPAFLELATTSSDVTMRDLQQAVMRIHGEPV